MTSGSGRRAHSGNASFLVFSSTALCAPVAALLLALLFHSHNWIRDCLSQTVTQRA